MSDKATITIDCTTGAGHITVAREQGMEVRIDRPIPTSRAELIAQLAAREAYRLMLLEDTELMALHLEHIKGGS